MFACWGLLLEIGSASVQPSSSILLPFPFATSNWHMQLQHQAGVAKIPSCTQLKVQCFAVEPMLVNPFICRTPALANSC